MQVRIAKRQGFVEIKADDHLLFTGSPNGACQWLEREGGLLPAVAKMIMAALKLGGEATTEVESEPD